MTEDVKNQTPIQSRLWKEQDLTYKEFQAPLIPNIDKDQIIGVRTPKLRSMAKEIFQGEVREREEFLNALPHRYLEENLLHFFVIAQIKEYEDCVKEVNRFLPYVNNWAVCDQSSPKCFKKNHERLIVDSKQWVQASHIYTKRFGIRMLMNEFLDADFKPEYLELVASLESDEYYLDMMIAWYFATALAKQYDAAIPYLEDHRLSPSIHKKTIQKAVDSYRILEERKQYLKSLRVK